MDNNFNEMQRVLEAQKKLLDNNGLKLISLAVSYKEVLNDPKKVIETAKYFESKYVVVGWIPHDANDIGFDKIKIATDFFNKSGKLLVTHSCGGDTVEKILKVAWKDKNPFPNKAKDIIEFLKNNPVGENNKYVYSKPLFVSN